MSDNLLKSITKALAPIPNGLYLLKNWKTIPEMSSTAGFKDHEYLHSQDVIDFFNALQILASFINEGVTTIGNRLVESTYENFESNEALQTIRNHFDFVWRRSGHRFILVDEPGFNYVIYSFVTGHHFIKTRDDSLELTDGQIVAGGFSGNL